MKVFFCWSGERSRIVAEGLRTSLESLNRNPKAKDKFTSLISPQIPKGEIWFDAISGWLSKADAAIVTLTAENLHSPWLHYEAGAIAQGFRATNKKAPRIYTYLFGVAPGELGSPLSQYQHTEATKADTLALLSQLQCEQAAREWVRKKGDKLWADLTRTFRDAAALSPAQVFPDLRSMFRRKTFDEPLSECMAEGWLDRYSGARETHRALGAALPAIRARCRPYARDLAEQLVRELDIYAMTLRSTLLNENHYRATDEGRLEIPKPIEVANERSRTKILRLQAALVDEASAPIFDDSPRFEALESFALRKAFVHRKIAELEKIAGNTAISASWNDPELVPSDERLKLAQSSDWILDRILFYQTRLIKHRSGDSTLDIAEVLGWCWKEWEKTTSQGAGATRMPLHYSLDALEECLPNDLAGDKLAIDLRELRDYLWEMEKSEASRIRRRLLQWDKRFGGTHETWPTL